MVMCPADHEEHRFPLPCVGLIVEMLSWKGLRWRPDGLASFFFTFASNVYSGRGADR